MLQEASTHSRANPKEEKKKEGGKTNTTHPEARQTGEKK